MPKPIIPLIVGLACLSACTKGSPPSVEPSATRDAASTHTDPKADPSNTRVADDARADDAMTATETAFDASLAAWSGRSVAAPATLPPPTTRPDVAFARHRASLQKTYPPLLVRKGWAENGGALVSVAPKPSAAPPLYSFDIKVFYYPDQTAHDSIAQRAGYLLTWMRDFSQIAPVTIVDIDSRSKMPQPSSVPHAAIDIAGTTRWAYVVADHAFAYVIVATPMGDESSQEHLAEILAAEIGGKP